MLGGYPAFWSVEKGAKRYFDTYLALAGSWACGCPVNPCLETDPIAGDKARTYIDCTSRETRSVRGNVSRLFWERWSPVRSGRIQIGKFERRLLRAKPWGCHSQFLDWPMAICSLSLENMSFGNGQKYLVLIHPSFAVLWCFCAKAFIPYVPYMTS